MDKEPRKPRWKKEWGKHPGGRPTIYKPEYADELRKFFDVEPTKVVFKDRYNKTGDKWVEEVEEMEMFPTLAGFAAHIQVGRESIWEWERVHPEFSDAVQWAKAKQEHILVQNGLRGTVTPYFAAFVARNLIGYQDKSTIEVQKSSHTQLLDAIEVKNRLEPGKEI